MRGLGAAAGTTAPRDRSRRQLPNPPVSKVPGTPLPSGTINFKLSYPYRLSGILLYMPRPRIPQLTASARIALAMLLAAAIQPQPARAGGASPAPAAAATPASLFIDPDLEAGVHLMYELKFDEARVRLASWQQLHPAEPMGSALEAASYLFEQFHSKGVMTSEFFLDDKRFLGGIEGKPDSRLESAFLSAAGRSEDQAHRRLSANPRDPDALLALTLVAGMSADNSCVIEKRQLQSITLLREAERRAHELLGVAPEATDAYVAIGSANYIVGSLPGYKRFFLRLGGVQGDKSLGIQQLTMAAADGHYLRPFAELLLALAALREMDAGLARRELTRLAGEFPANPLFAHELSKLQPDSSTGAPFAATTAP
jgi:hypothetical protein